MGMVKKIMVAVDFSEYSQFTRTFASDVINTFSAELIFLNVINSIEIKAIQKVSEHLDALSIEDYVTKQEKERAEKMEQLILDLKVKDCSHKILIRHGIPFEEILKVIDEEGIDLLILATKGRSKFADLFLNPTSEQIFRHCTIPVLNIPIK